MSVLLPKSSRRVRTPGPSLLSEPSSWLARYAAGMTRVAVPRTMSDDEAWAAVAWNCCSLNLRPPTRNEHPRTRSRLDRIEPRSDVWTMRSSPRLRARTPTMSSTALPKVLRAGWEGGSAPARSTTSRGSETSRRTRSRLQEGVRVSTRAQEGEEGREGGGRTAADRLAETKRALLGGIAEEGRERDDGDERDDEVGRRAPVSKVRDERERDRDEEDVEPAREEEVLEALEDGRRAAVRAAAVVLDVRGRRGAAAEEDGTARVGERGVAVWRRRGGRVVVVRAGRDGQRARVCVGDLGQSVTVELQRLRLLVQARGESSPLLAETRREAGSRGTSASRSGRCGHRR